MHRYVNRKTDKQIDRIAIAEQFILHAGTQNNGRGRKRKGLKAIALGNLEVQAVSLPFEPRICSQGHVFCYYHSNAHPPGRWLWGIQTQGAFPGAANNDDFRYCND